MRIAHIVLVAAIGAMSFIWTTDASAQRLSDSRVGVSIADQPADFPAEPQGRRGLWGRPANCSRSYKVDLALHAIGGAAVGYLAYALAFGVWGDGSGEISRRLRTTAVLGGAGAGMVYITARRLIDCQQLQGA